MGTDRPMQLGMVGLGRMGSNLVRRLMRDGHRCVVYDVSADAVKTLEGEGATGSTSLADFVAKLDKPRTVWLMVPAGWWSRRSTSSSRCWSPETRWSTGETLTTATTSQGPNGWRPGGSITSTAG